MNTRGLAAYGILALPLAMVALPVYIQVPSWYVQHAGLSLSTAGLVLFFARFVDTAQDPWMGAAVDVLAHRRRLGWALWCAAAALCLAFAGLWMPPAASAVGVAGWLALMLAITYSAHSLLNITLLAWGARLPGDVAARTRAAAWRETAGLAGVILASLLPAALARAGLSGALAMRVYALVFAALLVLALTILLRGVAPWPLARERVRVPLWSAFAPVAAVRRLWPPYALNTLAVSIAGTLSLFFIEDRIERPQWTGVFLALYFIAGAAGTPVWTIVARRIGCARAWAVAMILAVSTFCWAAFLGPGDVLAYAAVCTLCGLALGADLVLPPVLLAAAIPPDQDPAAHYGVWTFLGKIAVALSALSLPLLASAGYRPGAGGAGAAVLSLAYAGLPSVLKLGALVLLVMLVIRHEEVLP